MSTSGLTGNSSAKDGGIPTDAGADGFTVSVDGATNDARPPLGRYEQEVLADKPSAFYTLDETSGASGTSIVGGPEARLVGGITFGAPGAVQGSRAVVLDGDSGRIELGDAFAFGGSTSFSIELWVNPSLVDGHVRYLVSRASIPEAEGYALYFGGDFLLFSRTSSGAEMGYAGQSAPPPANVWTHIVATFDGQSDALFVDGVMKASAGAGPIDARPGSLALGDSAIGQTFKLKGALDEIAIYDHALSAARVAAHYAAR